MSATAVVAFGRFNPPTFGHQMLVAKLRQVARDVRGLPQLYLSQSVDPKTDPLKYTTKLAYCRAAFGDVVQGSHARTIIEVMQSLQVQKFTDVYYVAGEDRVRDFQALLTQYNGKEYKFHSIVVVSAGHRDPDAEGVVGASASKQRAAAVAGDQKAFIGGCPTTLGIAEKMRLYHDVRIAMGLKECADISRREEGTADLTKTYADDTPGQNCDEVFEFAPAPSFLQLKRALAL